jgi:microcystin-dependent protein
VGERSIAATGEQRQFFAAPTVLYQRLTLASTQFSPVAAATQGVGNNGGMEPHSNINVFKYNDLDSSSRYRTKSG